MIRLCDIVFSAIGLLLLSPLFLIVYILIRCESKGGGFYCQQRVGKDGRMFDLYKFRSMRTSSDKKGLITVGGHDSRITRMGYFIRKYKIDELPLRRPLHGGAAPRAQRKTRHHRLCLHRVCG